MGFNGLEFRRKAQAREISLIIICILAMRLDEITYKVKVNREEKCSKHPPRHWNMMSE